MIHTLFFVIQTFIERVLDQYKGMMMRLAFSILKDYQLAEDAVQEALLVIHRKESLLKNLDSPGSKNYIYTVTRNIALHTAKKRMNVVTFDDDVTLNNIEGEPDIEAFVDQYGFGDEVQELLSNLSQDDYDLIIYRYGGNYSYREIAKLTGIREATLRKRMERIRQTLRRQIESHENE